jgi:hypothetical protein
MIFGGSRVDKPGRAGVSLHTQWARVEPHEHANADDFYWGYLDQGMALGAAYGKTISILITAGVSCPQWLLMLVLLFSM